MTSRAARRRFRSPEVLQISATDCGPACLLSMLRGFGIQASYPRLREACEADVDGTSIDTLETLARRLGLDAEQVLIPVDHVPLPAAEAFPAIAVLLKPGRFFHFAVAWRRHGSQLQIMDPAAGRRVGRLSEFLRHLYEHAHTLPARLWLEWARSDVYQECLRQRLHGLGIGPADAERALRDAADEGTWVAMASLDAAIRMVGELQEARALDRGGEAGTALRKLHAATLDSDPESSLIPPHFWKTFPADAPADGAGEEQVVTLGAVFLRVPARRDEDEVHRERERNPLTPDLAAVLEEKPVWLSKLVLSLIADEARKVTPWTVLVVGLSVVSSFLLIIGMRGLIDLTSSLPLVSLRGTTHLMFVVLALASLGLEVVLKGTTLDVGRKLETRLRISFLTTLPRLKDRFFRSRLASDMAERFHSIHGIRHLPDTVARAARLVLRLGVVAAGVIWIDPAMAPYVVLAVCLCVAAPLVANSLVVERDLRQRAHAAALSRFYLDSLLGAVPLRSHSGEKALFYEHDGRLGEWIRASLDIARMESWINAALRLIGVSIACWLVYGHLHRVDAAADVLLLVYWSLQIPTLGAQMAGVVASYRPLRNHLHRFLEPLGAVGAVAAAGEPPQSGRARESVSEASAAGRSEAVELALEGVSVEVRGKTILRSIDLRVEPGAHVAIVGSSGAGKSTLAGLLLGWSEATSGRVLVDGHPLSPPRLAHLRKETCWVDPAVQLWNRSLLYNVTYGSAGSFDKLDSVIAEARLHPLLKGLPDGFQTSLGQNGELVSGGEGQRVRLARAMMRTEPRLVIMDEAFRGLPADQRAEVLAAVRSSWALATLLFISHQITETLGFDRVVVMEEGGIVEDGSPCQLAERTDSRYSAMLAAECRIADQLRSTESTLRQVRVENRRLVQEPARPNTRHASPDAGCDPVGTAT